MLKALTVPALALASALALGSTASAFAATAPTAPAPSASATATTPAAVVGMDLPSAVKPGDAIAFSVSAPAGSRFAISSAALDGVRVTEGKGGWTASATVARVKDGSYGVSLTGTGPDGAKIQATAQLKVGADAPKPTPAPSTVHLSKDFGRPGDQVVVTVRTSAKDAYVSSRAFAGGHVGLKGDGKGTFTGTATVGADVTTGYYGVDAFAGGTKFDTVKFSTEAAATPVKPHVDPNLKPLRPAEHQKPKGSVNTGQAPAATLAAAATAGTGRG
ncbi:hypothetical protein ABTX82_21315 [Streptomyces lavendulae]|uniref:hypothetical protein n=1 Tax=Streptomyces lavendulae TaxID=1914 RepID=UPI0024A26224|nr:hypothetical protein [Streptomyces lavendulae]GLW03227.1 hypothetical protein Slala05_68570 [Streptomyces lavendulae subsp. lavendulae]